jgi:hypothetical protein
LEGASGGKPEEVIVIAVDQIPRWSFSHDSDWLGAIGPDRIARDRASGWPLLSMRCRIIGQAREDVPVYGCIRLEPDRFRGSFGTIYLHRVLPLTPIWPGFAINTIFYAAVLWVLFAAPFKVRRWRRIKRGQCASCGYSLHENFSEKCPECGRPV